LHDTSLCNKTQDLIRTMETTERKSMTERKKKDNREEIKAQYRGRNTMTKREKTTAKRKKNDDKQEKE